MCSIDFDEQYAVWVQRERTASAEHKCTSCGATIRVGERYQRHFSAWLSSMPDEPQERRCLPRDHECAKVCLACVETRDEFQDEHGAISDPSTTWETLYECVDGLYYHPETAAWCLALSEMESRRGVSGKNEFWR